jgi:hypothetical protein
MCTAANLQSCRALVAGGADVVRRNNKNRVPGSQLKVGQSCTKVWAQHSWSF